MYKIVRNGEFCCYLKGTNYCSVISPASVSEEIHFKYKVTIKTDILNGQNYIIDQNSIQRYFDEIKSIDMSCEMLAYNSVFGLMELFRSERRNLKPSSFIEVIIYPPPYVSEIGYSLGKE